MFSETCIFWLLLPLVSPEANDSRFYSVHYRLVSELFKNYDLNIRPVMNPVQQMTIFIQPSLYQIRDVDSAANKITAMFSFDLYWRDSFLQWDPQKFDNITMVYVPTSKIWTPILSTWYSIRTDDTINIKDSEAAINYTGDVYVSVAIMAQSLCIMDIRMYPFDKQSCVINFGSFIHMVDTLRLVPLDDVDIGTSYPNQEWKLMNASVSEEHFTWYGDRFPYSLLHIKLEMKRQPFFYIFTMVMPVAIIVLLSLIGFHLPATSSVFMTGKMDLGMATLLSMTFLLYGVTSNLPRFGSTTEQQGDTGKSLSSTPILVVYYIWLFCQVAIAAILTSLLTYVDKILRMGGRIPFPISKLSRILFVYPEQYKNAPLMTREGKKLKNAFFEELMQNLSSINENLTYLRRLHSSQEQWSNICFRLNTISFAVHFILWFTIILMFFWNSWY